MQKLTIQDDDPALIGPAAPPRNRHVPGPNLEYGSPLKQATQWKTSEKLKSMVSSPIGRRFARGASWSFAGAIAGRGGGLLASVLLARQLEIAQYGHYGMVQSTVGMFGSLAGLGLGVTATKHVAQYRGLDAERAGRVIGFTLSFAVLSAFCAGLLLWILAPLLAEGPLRSPELVALLRIAAGGLFFAIVTGVQTGILAGFEAFRDIALGSAFQGLVSPLFTALGAYCFGLEGALWGYTATLCATWGVNSALMRRQSRHHGMKIMSGRIWSEWSLLTTFSIPALLASTASGPALWLTSGFLVREPGGYTQMALFTLANQWRVVVEFVPTLLGTAGLPLLAGSRSAKASDYRKVKAAMLVLAPLAGAAVAGPLILFAPHILRAYGPKYATGAAVFAVTMLASIVASLNNQMSRILASSGWMWANCLLELIWGGSFVGLAWILIPRYGALGLAESLLGSVTLQGLAQACTLHRESVGGFGSQPDATHAGSRP